MRDASRLLIVPGLLALWEIAALAMGDRSFILPGPALVFRTWVERFDIIAPHALITFAEIGLGLGLGALAGVSTALALAAAPALRRWMLPILVVSQAVPVFALAPILVLWLGYGLASKVAMAVVVIYFPVTAAFLDGLRRTQRGWLELARVMGARPIQILLRLRLPAALPALASGLRVATAVAPIGAVIGEWVGSSGGLGFLMLRANARMQVPMMFAALLTLAVFAVILYLAVDLCLRRALPWQDEDALTAPDNRGDAP